MGNDDLLEAVRRHELFCAASQPSLFVVAEVAELAPRVIAVRGQSGEHYLYWGRDMYQLRPGCALEDFSRTIGEFPEGIGLIAAPQAGDWVGAKETARTGLKAPGRNKIRWHRAAIMLNYK